LLIGALSMGATALAIVVGQKAFVVRTQTSGCVEALE
jgi:hypothetical protein